MKLTCDRRDLNDGLACVAGAVQSKSTIAVLSNVLIEANGDSLRLTATDLELRIERRVAAKVSEGGSITLPARLFVEIVAALPEKEVSISAGEGEATTEATITSGRSRYQIPTLSPTDFPVEKEVGSLGAFVLSQIELAAAIGQTVFAVSKDDTRPMLSGVLFEVSGTTLTLVATDTHRLALRRAQVENTGGEGHPLVSGRALTELHGSIKDGGTEPVRVQWDEAQIQFQTNLMTLVSRRLAGPFPNYQKILPVSFSRTLTFSRADLQQAVRRAEIVAGADNNRVRLLAAGEQLEVTAQGKNLGQAREEIEVVRTGDPVEIAFNARYLLDALGAFSSDSVVMELTEPLRPAVLRSLEEEGQLQLIMPMGVA